MPNLSAKYSLTPQEIEFCKFFASSGEGRLSLCYTKAFLVMRPAFPERGIARCYVEPNVPMQGLNPQERLELLCSLPEVTSRQMLQRAREKLEDPQIQRYLAELQQSPISIAETVLLEQSLFGDEKDARGAAVKILEMDQRANRRDDIFYFADVLDEAGFEVVVDFPTEVRRDVTCPECGHVRHVAFPVEGVAKFVAPEHRELPAEVEAGTDG